MIYQRASESVSVVSWVMILVSQDDSHEPRESQIHHAQESAQSPPTPLSTISVSLRVSSLVGQVTLRSSPTTSPMARMLKRAPGDFGAQPCELRQDLEPPLPYLPVHGMFPAPGAELLQFQPLRIVPPVLAGVIGPLTAVRGIPGL